MIARGRAANAAVVALLALLAAQVGAFIVFNSETFDEPAVVGAGYSYIRTGRIELETRVHPPLMKYLFGLFAGMASPTFDAASPALLNDQPYAFGLDFLFHNRASAESILAFARIPSLLLSLLLAVCVFAWAERWFGGWGGLAALAAYVTEPNILAHSGIASMDMGLSAFLFMAYFALVLYLQSPRSWLLALSGICAGCALASKIPGVFFFVWSAALVLAVKRKAGPALRINVTLFAIAAFLVCALYQFRFVPKLAGLIAQMAPAVFIKGHPTEQQFNFLLGRTKLGGWPYYYLVALAVKTTLPFLALSVFGFWKGLKNRERLILGIPTLSYLLICSAASKQNGVRYVLPVFPFLCVAIGSLARLKTRRTAAIVGALLTWAAVEVALIAPNYLAYFNELAGGPANGYRILVDSNLDWGQDFGRIKEAIERGGNPETIVACLGNGDRDYYFGPHQDLIAWEPEAPNPRLYRHVNSPAPAKEWLIVSASFLQGYGLTHPEAFAWLRGRAPLARPGYSTFIYDVTSDALSQFNIGKLYLQEDRLELARRQFARASTLAPEQPYPAMALGDVDERMGDGRKAVAEYRESLRRAASPRFRDLRPKILERLKNLAGSAHSISKMK